MKSNLEFLKKGVALLGLYPFLLEFRGGSVYTVAYVSTQLWPFTTCCTCYMTMSSFVTSTCTCKPGLYPCVPVYSPHQFRKSSTDGTDSSAGIGSSGPETNERQWFFFIIVSNVMVSIGSHDVPASEALTLSVCR